MELVCFQGPDKENWAQINALIKRGEWEKVFVIKDKTAEEFSMDDKCSVININSDKPLLEIKQDIIEKLKTRIVKDFEVALSIASGTGKTHMALLSALLSIPVGIRLVAFTKNGVEFIS